MKGIPDLRCAPDSIDGLHDEIIRRDKIIRSLMHQVERSFSSVDSDYGLLQNTFTLEEQVRERTAELKKSVEELEAFMAHAPVGILISHDHLILKENRKFEETFGLRGDTAVGKSMRILFRTESEFDYAKHLASPLLSASQTFQTELYMRRQDGEDLWINMIGYSLQSENADQSTIWMLEDRTAFKRAEEALQRSNEELEERVSQRTAQLTEQLHFLQQLIEAIPGPVFYKDDKVRYLGCNRAFEAYIGMPASQLLGKTPHDIAPQELAEKYLAADLALLHNPGYQVYESEVRYADGTLRQVMFHKATFTHPDGSVGGLVGLMMDITEKKQAYDKIEHLAYYDQLTNLPNRRLLIDRLRHAIGTCVRRHQHGALMIVDLDNFKSLNETQGYRIGDQLLLEVAQRLKTCVGEGDSVARLGADEFAVILEDLADAESAAAQAERTAVNIQEQLNRIHEIRIDGANEPGHARSCHCSASIGIALFCNQSTLPEELLKRADLAMYRAKAERRNSIRFFDPDIQAQVVRRAAIESDLRSALQQQQLQLYYQPQVDDQGAICGAEALLRWKHPERGQVSPAEFIPLAESTGLILPIGYWVIQQACSQLSVWMRNPDTAKLTLAVNVSALQVRQPEFVARVLEAVDGYGVLPGRLKIEITESLLLNDVDETIDKMMALKSHGVSFSLDDFGTGYSSLAYLKKLPLDQLKIDQSFVRNIHSSPNDEIIARTVVALGQSLGLNVIAEGVESLAQRNVLMGHGCRYFQGYLFSRPLPLEQFLQNFAGKP